MMRVALILFLACAVAAHAAGASAPRRALQQQLGVDRVRRLDGSGVAGARITELLANINQLAQAVPRIGSNSTASTASDGAQEGAAQTRGATAELRTLPLSTAGIAASTAGDITQPVSGTGSTSFLTNSTSVAKDILDDDNDDPESFGSSATAEGFTAVSSTDTGSGTSTTSGTANTAAGEKALRTLPRDDIFLDGASGLANIVQRAIGERVAARLQASTLSALSGASDESGRAQSGGSFLFAALDSTDDPARTIATVGKTANTAATLGTESDINRYGYSSARDAAAVTVDSTESSNAQVYRGRFGTGFNTGLVTAAASTYLKPTVQDEQDDNDD